MGAKNLFGGPNAKRRRVALALLVGLLSSFPVHNCFGEGDSSDEESYILKASIIPPSAGLIIRSPSKTLYAPGSKVIVEALSDEFWHFDHWVFEQPKWVESTENPIEVTVNADTTMYAIYVSTCKPVRGPSENPDGTCSLRMSIEGQGTVNIQPKKEKYEKGEAIYLTAIPGEDWAFDFWMGDTGIAYLDRNNPEVKFVINQNRYITVYQTARSQ